MDNRHFFVSAFVLVVLVIFLLPRTAPDPLAAPLTLNPTSGAGWGETTPASTWSAGIGGTSAAYITTALTVDEAYSMSGPNYNVGRAFMPVDTSGLAGCGTVTSATIHLYVSGKNNGDNDGNDYIAFVLPTTQASTTSLVAADIDEVGPVMGATEVTNRLDITSMAINQYQVWTIQPAYLSLINITGVTRLGLREGHDLLNDPVATNTISRIQWNSDNHASNKPFMTVDCAPTGPDTTPPFLTNGAPSGVVAFGTTSTTLSVTTNELATCRFSATPNVAYSNMTSTFAVTGGTSHSQQISGLQNGGIYVFYVKCADGIGNANSGDYTISFGVASVGFQNEIYISWPNLPLPLGVYFLPGGNGDKLIGYIAGKIEFFPAGSTQANPVPFLQLSTSQLPTVSQGFIDLVFDPNFASNHYFYVTYIAASDRARTSRFTANGATAVPGSELVLWEDTLTVGPEHYGGGIVFGNDGKIYFSVGDHLDSYTNPQYPQNLSSPRGKILRMNPDGTFPVDNPFYDGVGPNYDGIYAYGFRNPFRMSVDQPTGRIFIGDVGNNGWEEVNLLAAGSNYGWPLCEGVCSYGPGNPIFTYSHVTPGGVFRDASITGGFVYRGTQFPQEYQGNYFYADYAQNWIRRLSFNPDGSVTNHFFEPLDNTLDGPYGDIVHLTEGPDGAIYYTDLGFDVNLVAGVSKIRRIKYNSGNLPPVVVANATPTSGPTPLVVDFSSIGTYDPENQPLGYLWQFGDGNSSIQSDVTHTYSTAGQYTARLTVSDGQTSSLSNPIIINVGFPPQARITSPANGLTFRAGDTINFSGFGTDPEDGPLPDSALSWQINFLHEGHVHPGLPITGTSSGVFNIPTTGHDYSGNTRYEFALVVTDSDGLQSRDSVIVYPDKVTLTFVTNPPGLQITVDGIPRQTPFTYNNVIGFQHNIDAVNQTVGANNYSFLNWSDGGAQAHTLVVPSSDTTYTATFRITDVTPPIISNGTPTGALPYGTTSTVMSVATNENAVCRYSATPGTPYSSMIDFATTGSVSHSTPISGLVNGQNYTYDVRCSDASGNTTNAYSISFRVTASLVTTLTLNSTSGAGWGETTAASTWSAGIGGTSAAYITTALTVDEAYSMSGPNYNVGRAFMPVNTSGLAGCGTVTSATIHLYLNGKNNGDNDGNDYIAFVLPTTQASTTSLVAADISKVGPVIGATEVTNRLDITSMAINQYQVWTIQPAYLSLINITGVTRLGLREGHDLLNDPVAANTISRIKWNSDNHAASKPFLAVTCS